MSSRAITASATVGCWQHYAGDGRNYAVSKAGVTLDVPIGERAYFRAGYRLLFTAVVGFGVTF